MARRTAAVEKVRMHSSGADFGGPSRRSFLLTSMEPTSQLTGRPVATSSFCATRMEDGKAEEGRASADETREITSEDLCLDE